MVYKDFKCSWCDTVVELRVDASVSETGCIREGCPGVMKVIFRQPPHLSMHATPTRRALTRETIIRDQ